MLTGHSAVIIAKAINSVFKDWLMARPDTI
jgi:hypothetical protein